MGRFPTISVRSVSGAGLLRIGNTQVSEVGLSSNCQPSVKESDLNCNPGLDSVLKNHWIFALTTWIPTALHNYQSLLVLTPSYSSSQFL